MGYVLAYTQAPVEREIYMEVPKGYDLVDSSVSRKDNVLKIQRM
jgi:hypothetical protein